MKKSELMGETFKWSVLAAIIAVAAPDMAWAQSDVKDLLETATTEQLPVIPYVLSAVCYVGGAFLIVSGALSLKKHAEAPGSEPMGKGIARLITGGLITAVPAIVRVIQGSLLQDSSNTDTFNAFAVTF